ncbi:MAG: DUF2333 family protein [Pseudomonadales bacterium]|nr:DUF2333 family protein [Pseudomonadales bacterium]MDP4640095.1 DUF2333 family protein [Pseudomonadales bacterium]MDP4766402.1 DUF2333 family protein [Pseudomonadales bacterium]MDP4876069.1 DUF2333 family protein [Pseudomonadales bacterium]MDP4912357.1 DUF2333 family protein [Pseudomonadales bacterium]
MSALDKLKSRFSDNLETQSVTGSVSKAIGILFTLLLLLVGMLGYLWDTEPEQFDVFTYTQTQVSTLGVPVVRGSTTVATTIGLADNLLHKRGGYLTNDISPPGIFMDNVPNWEFGVLVQIRDMVRTLRNNMSRSQSQSTEDTGLVNAENQFYFDSDSWAFPETEDEYRRGIKALDGYLKRLGSDDQQAAQFYARADNLRTWLAEIETRLGSLSQRLSASIGKRQLNMALAGDTAASQSTATAPETQVKTPWTELDDVFYEARGTTWALLHLLRAVEVDFKEVLENKNALISMQQIIRELEPTQDTLWSPVILNGDGLGLVANHSLVMASHISRANAAIIDLRRLLSEG